MTLEKESEIGILGGVAEFGEMIKISHTLFAMPFAIGSALLAASLYDTQQMALSWTPLLQVIVAIAFARTAAMSFNRWADRNIDGNNPRTADRSIPAGRLSPGQVMTASLVSILGFIVTCAWISTAALLLAPLVLIVVLGYSYTKRVTWLSHVVLGIGLGLAPVGAWLVVTGELGHPVPWILGTAVLFWSAGFDIVYACQDVEVDKAQSLNSIPARFGVSRALVISRWFHGMMLIFLSWLCFELDFPVTLLCATLITAALLAWGHRLVNSEYRKVGKIENARLEFNVAISLLFLISMGAEAFRS